MSLGLDKIVKIDKDFYLNTYRDRTQVCFDRGNGMNLWDKNGNKYVDLLSGIAVTALGHSHLKIITTIKDQAEKLIHCSNLYYIEQQAQLAKILVENSCADRVFFANSGAEANEGSIKLARIYFKKRGLQEKNEIITLKNSFHGLTLATIAATGQEIYQKSFTPLLSGFVNIPINDIEALNNSITPKTCAIMLEPVQGEGGINLLDFEYISAVRKICDDNEILLIFDEVQCGLGRTGKLFGYQHFQIEPDIFTLAKALGGGFPIGALLAKEFVASAFEPGKHGSTFGGNPLACAVGLTVFEVIQSENLVQNAEDVGNYYINELNNALKKYTCIKEIRGKGLMIGIELNNNKARLINQKCFENGYLIGNVGDNILRILPPLIITKKHVDDSIKVFDKVFSELV